MDITVVCFGGLKERLSAGADGRVEVDVDAHASVGDVVDALDIPRALASMVLIDGEQAGLDDGLSEGAEVTLMPPFAGG